MSFAMDSMGAADGGCMGVGVGVGLAGEGGMAIRSRVCVSKR
jgi:hypothetical protein